MKLWKHYIAPVFSLLLSSGTLVCCALPALLVTLGMGATLAGFVGAFPQITVLSEHKEILFAAAGVMLVIAGLFQWRARNMPCPADPELAQACIRTRRVSFWIYIISVIIYVVGFFFAFIAAALFF